MGKVVYVLGDNISTDIIYPGRFMATVLPMETLQYAFADDAGFNAKLRRKEILEESIIVAGKNFGCGSSREQAASCLKGHGLTIVARQFARIFLQNSINLGLKTIVCPGVEASEGDDLEITADHVINHTIRKKFDTTPLPKARQAIIDAGGLIPYTRKIVLQKRSER